MPVTASSQGRVTGTGASPLVGRGEWLDRAQKTLQSTERARFLAIVGEPGIGKSRLAFELAKEARAAGALSASVACWEHSGAGALWPFRQLAQELEAATSSGAPAALRGGLGTTTDLTESLHVAASWLVGLASARELCLVIDDVHWADEPSLLLLELLARRCGELKLIVTWREPGAAPHVDLHLKRLWRLGEVLSLPSLEVDHVSEWLQRGGHAAGAGVAERFHLATGGNPFLLEEALRSFSSSNGRSSLSEAARDLVRWRLGLLSAYARTFIDVASVSGRQASFARIAACGAIGGSALQASLEEVTRHGLGYLEDETFCFRHDLVREATYEMLAPTERTRLHALWAESWMRTPDDTGVAGLVFEHLWLADADASELAAWGLRAADEHLAERDHGAARRIAERAHGRLPPQARESELAARLLVVVAEALMWSEEVERGLRICDEAARIARQVGSPTALAKVALARGILPRFSHVDLVHVALLREAIAAQPEPDGATSIRLRARLAAALQPSTEPEAAHQLARDALGAARRLGDTSCVSWVLLHGRGAFRPIDDLDERVRWDREAWRLSRDAGDAIGELRTLARLATEELELGNRERVETLWSRHGELATQTALPTHLCLKDQHEALLWTWRGDPERARSLLRSAAARRTVDRKAAFSGVDLQRVLLSRWWGRADWVAEALDIFGDAPDCSVVRGCAALWLGRREEAFRRYEQLRTRPYPESYIDLWQRPQLCAEFGSDVERRTLYAGLLPYRRQHVAFWGAGGATDGSVEALLGSLALSSNDASTAIGHFQRALDENERLGWDALSTHTRELLEYARARDQVSQRFNDSVLPSAIREPSAVTEAPALPLFTRDGEMWHVRYEEGTTAAKDSDGVRYLAHLIDNPNQPVHALELMAIRRSALQAPGGRDALAREAPHPVVDARAIQAYRARLLALNEAREEAETLGASDRADALREEQEELTAHLGKALGLGGRPRGARSASERARVNVTQRIRDAIRRLGSGQPNLAHHLQSCVKTGLFCSYRPPPRRS